MADVVARDVDVDDDEPEQTNGVGERVPDSRRPKEGGEKENRDNTNRKRVVVV